MLNRYPKSNRLFMITFIQQFRYSRSFLVSNRSLRSALVHGLNNVARRPPSVKRYDVIQKALRPALVVMSKLRQQRQQHPRHCGQRVPHLRALGLSLPERTVSVPVGLGVIVAVGVGVFLHGVHGHVPVIVSTKLVRHADTTYKNVPPENSRSMPVQCLLSAPPPPPPMSFTSSHVATAPKGAARLKTIKCPRAARLLSPCLSNTLVSPKAAGAL